MYTCAVCDASCKKRWAVHQTHMRSRMHMNDNMHVHVHKEKRGAFVRHAQAFLLMESGSCCPVSEQTNSSYAPPRSSYL